MSRYIKDFDDIPEDAPMLAHRIGELLRENEMTQGDLAKKINVTPSTITGWMKGDKTGNFTEPKINGLIEVAKYFEVSVDYLVGLSDSRKTELSYKMGAEYFGLHDESMKRLEDFQRRYKKQSSPCDWKAIIPIIVANYLLENEKFWGDFEETLFAYIELPKEENKEIGKFGIKISDVIKTKIENMFLELSHEILEKAIPKEVKPPKLFENKFKDSNNERSKK